LRSGKSGPRRGYGLSELGIVEEGAVLVKDGKIVVVGKRDEAIAAADVTLQRIDCNGGVVLPGFVDSHTHPAFMAPRLVDFEKRIAGATYEEISAAGGGIRSSVAQVRAATVPQISEKVLSGLKEMLRFGTTTVEAKSGYGLSVDAELNSVRAIKSAATRWPGQVSVTLLGAHVVPAEYKENPDAYVKIICEEMIPIIAWEGLAEWVDVFIEENAFTLEQAERIFAVAQAHKLGVRAHVHQFSRCELSRLQPFAPASLDHLDCVNDADMQLLAQQDTVATLLPAANYFLGHASYPPARKLIDAGVAVALATDYNPGTSPTCNMQFVLSVACTHMKMSPAEAIAAATINGAHALRLAESKGSIEAGKDADLALFDVEDYREIAYWFGANRCVMTMARGEIQFGRDRV